MQRRARIHHASSSHWLQRIHAPGAAAHTLTEVDGIVEIGLKIGGVGPATQKEVAPAQANTSRKRDAAVSQQHSQQQPVAPNAPRPTVIPPHTTGGAP